MVLIRKLLFIITINAAGFFTQECRTIADDTWQLDDSAELSDTEEIELGKRVDEYIRHQFYLRNDPELSKELNDITQRRSHLPVILSNRIPSMHFLLRAGISM